MFFLGFPPHSPVFRCSHPSRVLLGCTVGRDPTALMAPASVGLTALMVTGTGDSTGDTDSGFCFRPSSFFVACSLIMSRLLFSIFLLDYCNDSCLLLGGCFIFTQICYDTSPMHMPCLYMQFDVLFVFNFH